MNLNNNLFHSDILKRKPIKYSLVIILLFSCIAIYAPFIANNKPIAIYSTFNSFYEYYFNGWKKLHEVIEESLKNKDKYNSEREIILKNINDYSKIIKTYNQLGDITSKGFNDFRILLDNLENDHDILKEPIQSIKQDIEYLKKQKSNYDIINNKQNILAELTSKYNLTQPDWQFYISKTSNIFLTCFNEVESMFILIDKNDILKKDNNIEIFKKNYSKFLYDAIKEYITKLKDLKIKDIISILNDNKKENDSIIGLKDKIKTLSIFTEEQKSFIEQLFSSFNSEQLYNSFPNVENQKDNQSTISYFEQLSKILEKLYTSFGGQYTRINNDIQNVFENNLFSNQISLVKYNYYLRSNEHHSNIIFYLEQMANYLDSDNQVSLTSYISKYEILFQKIDESSSISPEQIASLHNIFDDILKAYSPADMNNKLTYLWLYPVFDSLSWIEIFLMISFPIFILLFFFFNRYHKSNYIATFIYSSALVIIIILTYFINLETNKYPPANYKSLLMNSLQDKSSSHNLPVDYAIFPLIPFGFDETNIVENLQKPSILQTEEITGRHLLGTDNLGRDVLSYMIWGTRVSLLVGFFSVIIILFIGILFGSLAGFFGGWIDIIISRIIEIVLCFPSMFIVLLLISFLEPNALYLIIIIGVTHWTGLARLVRGEVLRIKQQDYILAAKILGASSTRIILVHILPNAITPIIISAMFTFGYAILLEANLSFLGIGIPEPLPSWGKLINLGMSNPLDEAWLFFIPAILIFIPVYAYNLIGSTLRDIYDPKLKI